MKQNHIIHKVLVEINVKNKEKAMFIKDNINSFLTVDVFPKIEKNFNDLQETLTTHTLQVSHLTLELNESDILLDSDLKNNIAKLLKKELKEAVKPVSNQVLEHHFTKENTLEVSYLSEEDKLLQAFIYFIEKGYMPWWNSDKNTVTILETKVFKNIIFSKNFESKMSTAIQKPEVQERIINQLTDAQIKQLCLVILKNKSIDLNLETFAVQHLKSIKLAERNAIWMLVLNVLATSLLNSNVDLPEFVSNQITKSPSILNLVKENNTNEKIWNEIIQLFPFIERNNDFLSTKIKDQLPKSESKNVQNFQTSQSFQTFQTFQAISNPEKLQTISNLENQKDQQKFLEQNINFNEINSVKNQELALSQNESLSIKDKKAIKRNSSEEKRGFFIENAGLVLLHPFMKNLFMHCKLIDLETQKLNNPELCVHLLHYIATGKANQLESDMLFEKFLCNIPFQQSISRHIKLSSQHKEHAKKVIEAVQQNWSAMKTASVGLIQNEFLQRPGKLVQNTADHTLTIERKTQDILLNKLSWGISFMKLPWQDKVIYINW